MSLDRGRVVVISARVGAGHDGFTAELSRRLRADGFSVDQLDFVDLLPGPTGRGSLRLYHQVLRHTPWLFGALFEVGTWRPTAAITRLMLVPARRRLEQRLGPDVRAVVSAYPLASQLVGPLRTSGRLPAASLAYVTDFAVHRQWVSPGIDVVLCPHEVGTEQARQLGARDARVGGALVAPGFRPASGTAADTQSRSLVSPEFGRTEGRAAAWARAGERAREAARARFGLPPGPLALVVAGSWGVGRVAVTAAEIRATGVATPVVVCGRNDALRRRLARRGLLALGWVSDMPALMRAVDILVENAGGLMAMEGIASGLPVVTYRPIPGHGRRSAAALARAGLSDWVRDPRALGPTIARLLRDSSNQRRAARDLFTADAAAIVAELADAARPRGVARVGASTAEAVSAAGEAPATLVVDEAVDRRRASVLVAPELIDGQTPAVLATAGRQARPDRG